MRHTTSPEAPRGIRARAVEVALDGHQHQLLHAVRRPHLRDEPHWRLLDERHQHLRTNRRQRKDQGRRLVVEAEAPRRRGSSRPAPPRPPRTWNALDFACKPMRPRSSSAPNHIHLACTFQAGRFGHLCADRRLGGARRRRPFRLPPHGMNLHAEELIKTAAPAPHRLLLRRQSPEARRRPCGHANRCPWRAR